jgi:hypothetical protein
VYGAGFVVEMGFLGWGELLELAFGADMACEVETGHRGIWGGGGLWHLMLGADMACEGGRRWWVMGWVGIDGGCAHLGPQWAMTWHARGLGTSWGR